ncbi:hypothetical protein [uncultured Roseobacter sp.]|uniref:hypothetical protein n=1 Tax=uncultured Roseobacter sp. TaxID=114847 RepID=UPI00260EE051|nr:hypothetical protein [uncultured Roseobacter sp.]
MDSSTDQKNKRDKYAQRHGLPLQKVLKKCREEVKELKTRSWFVGNWLMVLFRFAVSSKTCGRNVSYSGAEASSLGNSTLCMAELENSAAMQRTMYRVRKYMLRQRK